MGGSLVLVDESKVGREVEGVGGGWKCGLLKRDLQLSSN